MIRLFLALSLLLCCTTAGIAAESFFTQPLYSNDLALAAIELPSQHEIETMLAGEPSVRNIVLNYAKTALYTQGAVSAFQHEQYRSAIESLDETRRSRIGKLVAEAFSKKNITIKVVDVTRPEQHLPLSPD